MDDDQKLHCSTNLGRRLKEDRKELSYADGTTYTSIWACGVIYTGLCLAWIEPQRVGWQEKRPFPLVTDILGQRFT